MLRTRAKAKAPPNQRTAGAVRVTRPSDPLVLSTHWSGSSLTVADGFVGSGQTCFELSAGQLGLESDKGGIHRRGRPR